MEFANAFYTGYNMRDDILKNNIKLKTISKGELYSMYFNNDIFKKSIGYISRYLLHTKVAIQAQFYGKQIWEENVEFLSESVTYTIDFYLGRGYEKFICWECKNEIKLNKRKRFVKCPQCYCWNIHPVWKEQGENFMSFLRKTNATNLLFLLFSLLFVLFVCLFSRIFYN